MEKINQLLITAEVDGKEFSFYQEGFTNEMYLRLLDAIPGIVGVEANPIKNNQCLNQS